MVKETLDKILSAEQEANNILTQALEDAKKVNAEAELEAKKILEEGKEDINLDRQKTIDTAKIDAKKKQEHILKLGEEKAGQIKKNSDAKTAIEDIVKAFLLKYNV